MKRTLIQNALVIDGTGSEGYPGDLLVEDGRIAAIGQIPPSEGMEVIDAAGRVACPGFIDLHRHCDLKVLKPGFGEAELRQGITTILTGNCGITLTPSNPQYEADYNDYIEPILGRPVEGLHLRTFPEYLDRVEQQELPLNLGAMIGTGSTRIAVKGFADTPFTPEEMAEVQRQIGGALEAGAFGASLGIMYIPECYGTTEEFAQMVAPVKEYGGMVACHIRGEGDSMVQSAAELIEIGRRAGVPVELSHFKSVGLKNWRRDIYRAIELIDQARARGQDVTVDFYPYEGGSTMLSTMVPPSYIQGDMMGALRRLSDPAAVEQLRRECAKEHPGWDNFAITLGWDRILISGVGHPYNKKYIGRSVTENAELFGFEDPVAFAAYLLSDEEGRVAIINMSMDPSDIDAVAQLPYSSVISDSLYADADTPHPRMYGSFPKILRDFVRERRVLTLPEAIRKMTSLPAWRAGFAGRGVLQPGAVADLLVFDPDQFQDNATFADPTRLATGLSLSMIGGEIVLRDDQVLRWDAGRLLRHRG